MWRCTNCGERVENTFEVCWNCQGEQKASREEEPISWECEACGADVGPEDTICANCGADISEVGGPQVLCAKCGARVDDDATFCSSCAAPIWTSDLVSCPGCGKSISAEARFCKYCAMDLRRFAGASVDSGASAQSSQNATAGNLILFGVVLGIVSAVAYLWGASYAGNFSNAWPLDWEIWSAEKILHTTSPLWWCTSVHSGFLQGLYS
jgi:predicted amidophosphoribosyltransferase